MCPFQAPSGDEIPSGPPLRGGHDTTPPALTTVLVTLLRHHLAVPVEKLVWSEGQFLIRVMELPLVDETAMGNGQQSQQVQHSQHEQSQSQPPLCGFPLHGPGNGSRQQNWQLQHM